MTRFVRFAILTIIAVPLVSCASSVAQSDTNQQVQQAQGVDRIRKAFPLPNLTGYEYHIFEQMYLARDQAVATYNYVQSNYTGHILWFCEGRGFPIDGGSQLTNPQYSYNSALALPQSDPNALYSPGTSAGTWVPCVNRDGTLSPARIEAEVQSYLTPMREISGTAFACRGRAAVIFNPEIA